MKWVEWKKKYGDSIEDILDFLQREDLELKSFPGLNEFGKLIEELVLKTEERIRNLQDGDAIK